MIEKRNVYSNAQKGGLIDVVLCRNDVNSPRSPQINNSPKARAVYLYIVPLFNKTLANVFYW